VRTDHRHQLVRAAQLLQDRRGHHLIRRHFLFSSP
jgi:hypothetical protein